MIAKVPFWEPFFLPVLSVLNVQSVLLYVFQNENILQNVITIFLFFNNYNKKYCLMLTKRK